MVRASTAPYLNSLLHEFVAEPFHIGAPILVVLTKFDVAMKRGPFPVFDTFDQLVFHWIDVDIIDTVF